MQCIYLPSAAAFSSICHLLRSVLNMTKITELLQLLVARAIWYLGITKEQTHTGTYAAYSSMHNFQWQPEMGQDGT